MAAASGSDLELDTLDLLADGVDSPLTSLSTMPPLDDDEEEDVDTVPMPSIAGVPASSSGNAAAPPPAVTRMPRLHLPPSAAAALPASSVSAVPKMPVSKNNK